MENLTKKHLCLCIGVLLCLTTTGCDFIYGLLHKEGAEEKQLVGDIIPLERSSEVEKAQRLLKLFGYPIGKIDGVLGPNTRKALFMFQKDQQWKAHGFIDKKTWEYLNQFEKYSLVVGGEVNLLAVQIAMDAAGISVGKIDGKLGPKTKEAILAFQKKEGLNSDGKIGFRTLKALSQYLLVVSDVE